MHTSSAPQHTNAHERVINTRSIEMHTRNHDITVLCVPRQAVDNARLALEGLVDQLDDVCHNLLRLLGDHRVLQVGAVETLSKPRGDKGLMVNAGRPQLSSSIGIGEAKIVKDSREIQIIALLQSHWLCGSSSLFVWTPYLLVSAVTLNP